jgi:hypothetical protein
MHCCPKARWEKTSKKLHSKLTMRHQIPFAHAVPHPCRHTDLRELSNFSLCRSLPSKCLDQREAFGRPSECRWLCLGGSPGPAARSPPKPRGLPWADQGEGEGTRLRSPRARVAGLSRECWRWPGLGGREWPPLLCIVTQAISCLEV